LADGGLPVAPVVAEGPDFLVVPDLGPTLDRMLLHRTPGLESAFAAAGGALARLHRAGYAHGRPALRDICWDGHEARLIDLENFDAGHSAPWRRAMDVVVLAQTHFTQAHDMPGPLALAIDAYRAGAGPQAWAAVQRLARLLVPLGWLAAGLYRLRPISRELRAVPLALAVLRARS
jgi:tRNA A-37 threonylcarbamoyl transferase component Bud32